jgi:hypothetical protein
VNFMRATSSAHSAFASCCPRKSRSINGTWPSALLCLAMAAARGVDARGVCPSRRASSAGEPYIVRTRCPNLKRQPRGFRASTHWAPYAHAEPRVLWSSERARQLFRKRTLYASISLGAWWCQASSVSIRCRPIWPALCRRTSSSRNWMIFAAKSIGSLGFA